MPEGPPVVHRRSQGEYCIGETQIKRAARYGGSRKGALGRLINDTALVK